MKYPFLFVVSAFFLLFPFAVLFAAKPDTVVTYNLEPLQNTDLSKGTSVRAAWDEGALVTALQGIVNRKGPKLYLFFVHQHGENIDRYWFNLLCQPAPNGKKGWLQDSSIIEAESLEDLLRIFRGTYQGAVIYDERVPATSNLALTIAGTDDLLPLRYDPDPQSLYSRLVTDRNGPQIPVKVKLLADDGTPLFTGQGKIPGTDLDSTGSAKTDAYRWLTEHYIKTGKTSSSRVGYYIDAYWLSAPYSVQNNLLTNRDYFIASRAPFVDLSPWNDEVPNDDPAQPLGTDEKTLTELFTALVQQNGGKTMIHVGGFVHWDTKYTDYGTIGGKHGGVDSEWKLSEFLSQFNAYLDADAIACCAMANASFSAHYPLKQKYTFKKPAIDDLKKRDLLQKDGSPAEKTFVTLYIGDYDSAAWVYQMMPHIWNDPNRGTVPISWAFNPNLADRFPPGFDYFRQTATPNDFFVAGDSGAGYVNPMGLAAPRSRSKLPPAAELWSQHCTKYYQQWDISITGFLIDGFSPQTDEEMKKVYAVFSPDGIVLQGPDQIGITDGMPWIGMKYDLPKNDDPTQAAEIVLNDVQTEGRQFLVYRTILWTPTQVKELYEKLKSDPVKGDRIEIVDMYSFFLLLKKSFEE